MDECYIQYVLEIHRECEARHQHRDQHPAGVRQRRGRGQQRRHPLQPRRALPEGRPQVL